MPLIRVIFGIFLACFISQAALAQKIVVRDLAGHKVVLEKPASRLVVLSPTPVEVLYEIGADSAIVAAVDYTDYPAEAKKLPRVGNAFSVSLDAIIRYQPDLVIAWKSQSQDKVIERLRELNIPVYVTNPLSFEDIAHDMRALGRLTGVDQKAEKVADAYEAHLKSLRQRFSHRKPIKVFLQLNETPIFTVSNQNILGKVINICGGRNIFGQAKIAAPQVSIEAVVRAKPEVIIGTLTQRFDIWLKWPTIPAVAKEAIYLLPDETISRPGPRLPEGIEVFCQKLEDARKKIF